MKFDLLFENYLTTLLEGRPKTDHDKEISLDFDDIEKYISKMSEDNLNKPIYTKILEFLKSDNDENKFTVSKIKKVIETNLKDHFDNKKSVEFNTNEFFKLFINQRKAFSSFQENEENEENEENGNTSDGDTNSVESNHDGYDEDNKEDDNETEYDFGDTEPEPPSRDTGYFN
mgnify:FL=1|jgi:hypothetical protein